MNRILSIISVAFVAGVAIGADQKKADTIIPADAVVEKVAGDFKFTEGPAWDYKGSLYFTDIPNNQIIKLVNGKCEVWRENSGGANGLMFDAQKRLVACEGGARRMSRSTTDNKWEKLADQWNGRKLNSPNDLAIDEKGRIYFTDPRYGKMNDIEQDKESVYRIDVDGKVARVVEDTKKCNGIQISPDGKTLYVVDNGAGELRAYPLGGDGSVGTGRTLAKAPHGDGMCVDEHGNIYVACQDGVRLFDKYGKQVGLLPIPEQPSNCVFGGDNCQTLFITARTGLYKIKLNARGWQIQIDGVLSAK